MRTDNSDLQTKDGPEIRADQIRTLVQKYETLTASEKLKLLSFIKADIKADRDRLASELTQLDAALGTIDETAPAPKRTAPKAREVAPRSADNGGGMTYSEAILEALKGGDVLEKQQLFHKANTLAGGRLKLPTFSATLPTLKKAKKIKSPGRAQFQIA